MVSRPRVSRGVARVTCLALVSCLAMSAIGVASASALTLKLSKAAPLGFTASGGPVLPVAEGGPSWQCSSSSAAGTVLTESTAQVKLTLHGCKLTTFWNCQSAGQETGTIVTNVLSGKLVYLDAAKTKFGVLWTPPASGVVAQFTCAGGLASAVWSGNGIISQITEPALNVQSERFTFNFVGVEDTQQYEQIEGAGLHYSLTQNGRPMSLTEENRAALAGGATGKFIP
jgi:hypothetical protein